MTTSILPRHHHHHHDDEDEDEDRSVELEVDAGLLFFNRVPKTGSMNMVSVLQAMSRYNGFTHRSGDFDRKQLSREEQVRARERLPDQQRT